MKEKGVHLVKVFGKLSGDKEHPTYSEVTLYWGYNHRAAMQELENAHSVPGMEKVTYEWIPDLEKLPIWAV